MNLERIGGHPTNTSTPLLSTFNNRVDDTIIQWCTPSIHKEVPRVRGIYENDISVSYHSMGNPCTNTGIFLKAHQLAAQTYDADHTLFSVNGTTGSNFIILRALKQQLGSFKLLAQRNVHKSIAIATEDYQIDVTYLPPRYHDQLQIFIPNAIEEIIDAVREHQPQVLLLTNPTYEGLSLYLPELVTKVRNINPNLIIYIDEAWGAHFNFSDLLPTSAMNAGADIAVQSTHKQGSGLQQTGMIHLQGTRVNFDLIAESYRSLTTTSPSYHLLASLDGARFFMEHRGREVLERAISLAEEFRSQLNTIPGLHAYSPREVIRSAGIGKLQIDPTKILIHLDGYSGMELAERLELNHGIVVEKYESENILLIMKLQNHRQEINATVKAIRQELAQLTPSTVKFPPFPTSIHKQLAAYQVPRTQKTVLLAKALGQVCAETIVPYPPGIPLITKGEVIQASHIEYLKALTQTKGLITVIAQDPNVITITVVKE